MPGLAASSAIFEHLELPKEKYQIHYLEWLIPDTKEETLDNYVKRLCKKVSEDNFVLIGVSFGGIIVQEMSKYIKPKQVIIISSVKHENELPKRLQYIRNTKAYKLAPISVLTNIEHFAKYAFGDFTKKRVELYRKYLSVRNKTYLTWAIYNVLHWKQTLDYSNVIHIHGNEDRVFPIKNIKNAVIVEKGTHIMILNKAKKINIILQEVIKFN